MKNQEEKGLEIINRQIRIEGLSRRENHPKEHPLVSLLEDKVLEVGVEVEMTLMTPVTLMTLVMIQMKRRKMRLILKQKQKEKFLLRNFQRC